jgi:predicted GNAT family acetyltransferase
MYVMKSEGKIIAAMRIYPKKKQEEISLYQFAVDPDFRGRGFMKTMLSHFDFPFVTTCLNFWRVHKE